MKKKRNLAIFSLNGSIMMPDDKIVKQDEIITEELISKTFFKTDDLDDIRFTKIDNNMFEDIKDLEENVRIYYLHSDSEIWNYNPILSAYIGELIYSPLIVFVAEYELDDELRDETMENELFIGIVTGFINVCNTHIQKVLAENSSKEENSKRSPLFKISSIKFYASQCPEYTESFYVEPGEDYKKYDEIWKKYYTGKYIQELIYDCVLKDNNSNEVYTCYMLMKPSLVTLYCPLTGDISIYMTSYTREILGKVIKKIANIDDKLDPEKIKEEKEKIMNTIYS